MRNVTHSFATIEGLRYSKTDVVPLHGVCVSVRLCGAGRICGAYGMGGDLGMPQRHFSGNSPHVPIPQGRNARVRTRD